MTAEISRNGAPFEVMDDGAVTEMGHGAYAVSLSYRDCQDLGWVILRLLEPGVTLETYVIVEVSVNQHEKRRNYLHTRNSHREDK